MQSQRSWLAAAAVAVTVAAVAVLAACAALAPATAASASPAPPNSAGAGTPDLGPNVMVFDPSMPQSQIQAAVDAIAAQQIPNQFGTQR
jgi:hypothetical protein